MKTQPASMALKLNSITRIVNASPNNVTLVALFMNSLTGTVANVKESNSVRWNALVQ